MRLPPLTSEPNETSAWHGAGRENGPVIEGRKGSYRNPWVDISSTAQKQMTVLGARLGLTPQSRRKLGVTVGKPSEGIHQRNRKKDRPAPDEEPDFRKIDPPA